MVVLETWRTTQIIIDGKWVEMTAINGKLKNGFVETLEGRKHLIIRGKRVEMIVINGKLKNCGVGTLKEQHIS